MKFRALKTLLALQLVLPSPGDALTIPIPKPSIPKPQIPDPVPAGPVPRPGADPDPAPAPKPDPTRPDIPDTGPAAYGPERDYPLGKYTDSQQAPFADSTDEWDPFFSKVYDILAAAETAKVPTDPDAGPGNGFPNIKTPTTSTLTEFRAHCTPLVGQHRECVSTLATLTITTSVDVVEPTKACDAWSSLSVYCGGGGTECACYSGTYYVPDQWNTLAGICAQAVVTTSSTTEYSTVGDSASSSISQLSTTYYIGPTPTPFHPISFNPRPISIPDIPLVPTIPPVPPLLPPRDAISKTRAKREENSIWLVNLVEAASSLAYYCPTPTDTPTYAFGAATPTPSDDSAPCSNPDMLRFKVLAFGLCAVLFGQLDLR